MNSDELKCPQCGFIAASNQNFCGDCGLKLKSICTGCNTANPPGYKFCGQCGKDLRPMGTLVLDRTGLIVEADRAANGILQIEDDEVIGKSFSVFVSISDRAFFFSKWNQVLSTAKQQDLEVEFRTVQEKFLFTHLVLKPHSRTEENVNKVTIKVEDITDRRNIQQQLEEKEKTFTFIGSLAEMFHPSNRTTRKKTITGVLEKIGVITCAQFVFIARIDPVSKLVIPEFKWQKEKETASADSFVPLHIDAIHPILKHLQLGKTHIVENINSLEPGERHLWKKFHSGLPTGGSIISELVYRDRHPIGIISIIRKESGIWPKDSVILIRLLAQLISDALPKSLSGKSILELVESHKVTDTSDEKSQNNEESIDLDMVEVIIEEPVEASQNANPKMVIENSSSKSSDGALPVFSTNDGVYVLKCPKCEYSESVAASQFEKSGWILKVTCTCGCSFRVIHEQRKTYRKEVQLPGLYARNADELNKLAVSRKWNSMEVTNISKQGVNFMTPMARTFQVGEEIQLRFNLDNSSKSLIKKSAQIKSIRKNHIGCNFESGDKHDITLGFYFL